MTEDRRNREVIIDQTNIRLSGMFGIYNNLLFWLFSVSA